MDNIYLVGFMGSGKTTVGKILAHKIDKAFIEMDEVIEADTGKPITEIFAQEGEAHFRRLENKLLRDLSVRKDLVVSCGGGLICNEENLRILKETGKVFFLRASAKVVYQRTKHHTHRPLLNVDNPLGAIEELLKERNHFYTQAHYTIDTDNISAEEVADSIVEILNK